MKLALQMLPALVLLTGLSHAQFQTNVHHGLALESEIHDVSQDRQALDAVIKAANTRITKKKGLNRQEALEALKTIHQILQEQQPRFVSHVLRENDCKTSIIYVAVGEALGLPIRGVLVPNHIFVRYELGPDQYINWETVWARVVSDRQYIKNHNIDRKSILNGAYMKNLSPSQMTAIHYTIVGKAWGRRKAHNRAMRCYNEAIRRYPACPGCYNQRGLGWLDRQEPQNALTDLNEALSLDPNYAKAHYNRGLAFIWLNRLQSALNDFNRSLELDPKHAKTYYWRGYARMRRGDVKGAVEDRQQATQLDANLLYQWDYTR